MKRVVLISCVSKKLLHKSRAENLYISPLFKLNLQYAHSLKPDYIFILSAKYGLVDLKQKLSPYNQTLKSMRVDEVVNWAGKVTGQLKRKVDLAKDEIIFLAGERYRKYLIPYITRYKIPLQGLSIGKQLQYLKNKQSKCEELHKWLNSLMLFRFPFDEKQIPFNGLYVLFEKGERAHGVNRIVRVGTHTGQNQLRSRLKQHFLTENKDRSIFRKNIGRCILNKSNDPYLQKWEWDLTSKQSKNKYSRLIDLERQKEIEKTVTKYIQNNFNFIVLQIDNKQKRLELESKIISTVSLCESCHPSKKWLGLYSPKEKIRESGLWLVNELYKEPISHRDFEELEEFVANA